MTPAGDFSTVFSFTAAHGITPRVARTWYQFLLRTPRVLVPVHLEALIVRAGGGQWAECGMSAPPATAEGPVDAAKLLPEPFTNLKTPRPKGAYLHWALPDALTHGEQVRKENPDGTESTEVVFPAIPDRWLVLRLYPSPRIPNRRTIRGWILQAHDPTPVPIDLDSWSEPGTNPAIKKPLTALGHGDPGWSAYYDNVVNRMAFYDSLSDVKEGPITYVVCGWYADQSLDPLGDDRIRSLADFEAKMKELNWGLDEKDFKKAATKANNYAVSASKAGLMTTVSHRRVPTATSAFDSRPLFPKEPGSDPKGPPYVTNGNWWPESTLFHGSVVGIGWPGIGWKGNEKGVLSGEEGGPPKSSDVKVAFGSTLAEGLAALVGKASGSIKDTRILEAFQQGMLNEFSEPDGRARLDAQLHAAAFGSVPGGEVLDRVWRPPSGTPPPPTQVGSKVGAGIFERHQRASTTRTQAQAPVFERAQTTIDSKNVIARQFEMPSAKKEAKIQIGKIDTVLKEIFPTLDEPFVPGRWEDVVQPLPRFFHPDDPAILIQGLKRSFQFGHDGRFTADGSLLCRLTGTCLKEYVEWHGDIAMPPITPDDVLDRGVENGSVPPECEEILGEVAMLDPGSASEILNSGAQGQQVPPPKFDMAMQRVMVQQTAWWAMRDPRVDHGPLIARGAYTGVLPSPVAVTPPSAPWSPVHLEWRIEYIASPDGHKDWELGESDYNESVPELPPAGTKGITFQGRSSLSAGANLALAQSVRASIEQINNSGGSGKLPANKPVMRFASELSGGLLTAIQGYTVKGGPAIGQAERDALEDIATALTNMDLLSASLDGLNTLLRGGIAGDGESTLPEGAPLPSPFHVVRSGFFRVLRLRLVDCFGQFVDLAGSGPNSAADPNQIVRTEPLDVTSRKELLALPPRFTSPARVWLRYMDASGSSEEARVASDIKAAISPVCGYLMPNHIDNAMLFYDVNGADVGVVRTAEDGRIVWEDAPGKPASVGQSPLVACPNKFLGNLGQGLVDWGIADAGLLEGHDTALDALMRVVDSTLWSIDPFGHQGEEHLALLLGHPVAVLRAVIRLDVKEPVDPATAAIQRVPVRLGSLAHWQDGLFGFFVNDDYKRLYCAPAAAKLAREVGPGKGFLQQVTAVPSHYNNYGKDIDAEGNTGATPVQHPYVDTSGVIELQPGQEIRLTLLVEPFTLVHATSGIVPRKDIGTRREWMKDALAKLSPTFRFGPVLIDPERIRMPIPHDLNGTWSWDHRTDVNTWANTPVTHIGHEALLSPDPPSGSEGWLRLTPPTETP